MNNNQLATINQDSKLVLIKAKRLLDFLKTKNQISTCDLWIDKILFWADENNISIEIIPRNKIDLLKIKKLELYGKKLKFIPKEICNLIHITYIDLSNNNLIEIPKEISRLDNLIFLSIGSNKLNTIPLSLIKLNNLKNFWFAGNDDLLLTEVQLLWINKLKKNGCYIYE